MLIPNGLTREVKIRRTVAIVVIGFFASVVWHYIRGMFWDMPFPQNTFLMAPVTRFGDFYSAYDTWGRLKFTGIAYSLSYFPSAYLFVEPFLFLKNTYKALDIFLTGFCLYFAVYASFQLRVKDPFESALNVIMCAMTFPFLFAFHTANFEIVVFVTVSAFILLYPENRWPLLTTFFLAIPVSMKLFPAVFILLLVADKRYKEIFYTLGWIFILSLFPLLIFRGGLSSGFAGYWMRLRASQTMYANLMIMSGAGIHFGHSLLGALRILLPQFIPPMQKVLFPYFVFTLVVFIGLSAYIIRTEKVFWKKVTLLIVAMDLLPYTSTDYKLMHFFIAFFLFVNAKSEDPLDLYYVLGFALLFIPKDYTYFNNWPYNTLNVVLNPFIMLALGLMIVTSGLRESRKVSAVIKRVAPPS